MKKGIICSAFDLLHAGHVLLLEECKKRCHYLVAGLHVNPQLERKNKNKPTQSLIERQIQLRGCRYIDEIVIYETEKDLEDLLTIYQFDIRFLGEDYKDGKKHITSKDICPITYISRKHSYSSTELRERIKNVK